MEWNTVERAIKTETDTRIKKKEWASSVAQHSHHVKVTPRDEEEEKEEEEEAEYHQHPQILGVSLFFSSVRDLKG